MAKAERQRDGSPPFPLDLVVVPLRKEGKSSASACTPACGPARPCGCPRKKVPVLRARLKELDRDFGFDPKGHSGKALRHSVASLPRDLVIAIDYDELRDLS